MIPRPRRQGWRPRPAATATSVAFDDEVVVYCERRERMHCLDPCASLVWALCDGSRTASQVAAEAAALSGASAGQLRADVDGLLAQLCELGILR